MSHLSSQEEYGATGAPYIQTSALPIHQPQGVAVQTRVDQSYHRQAVFTLSLSLPPLTFFTDLKTPKSTH